MVRLRPHREVYSRFRTRSANCTDNRGSRGRTLRSLLASVGFSGPNHEPAPMRNPDTAETDPRDTVVTRHTPAFPEHDPSAIDSRCPSRMSRNRDALLPAHVEQNAKSVSGSAGAWPA